MTYLNEMDLRNIWEDYWHDHMNIHVTAKEVANELQKVNSQSYAIELEKSKLITAFLTITEMNDIGQAEDEFAKVQEKMMEWGEKIIDGEIKNCKIITL